jgi:hypothetical protein
MKTIKELKKEYKWMAKNGIDLSGYNVDYFIKQPNTPQRSFKSNPTAVKNLHNYKFKFNRDIDSGILALYERIENLKFKKL